MTRQLATVEGTVSDLQFAVRATALAGQEVAGETFDETLLRVRDGVLDTPAGALTHLPAVYTTFTDDCFDRIDASGHEPVRALVNLLDLQVLLGTLPETERVQVVFNGDPDSAIAEEVVIDAGDERITLAGVGDPEEFADISVEMPTVFESGRANLSDGRAASTVVRTSGEALRRIVETVDAVGYGTYPIHVGSDGLSLDVETAGVHVESSLEGTLVEGEPVANDYDDGFAVMAETLSGTVRIETGPGDPAAFVSAGDGYTLRVVLEHT